MNILFTITDAGKNAVLHAEQTGVMLKIKHLAIGRGRTALTKASTQLNNEIQRFQIVAGGIEPTSHTMTFSVNILLQQETSVYEIGVYTEDNILFAVASSQDKPLFKIYPEINFLSSFGLTLNDFSTEYIQIVLDTQGALAQVLLQQHLSHENPHPQYLIRSPQHQDILNTEQLLRLIEPIKVGGLLITTNNYQTSDDVRRGEGYGRWQRFGNGQAIVALQHQGTTQGYEWLKTIGGTGGEYTHQLTLDEMPEHKHSQDNAFNKFGSQASESGLGSPGSIDGGNSHNEYGVSGVGGRWADATEKARGKSQAHNNVQPSIVVGVWKRMPDEYNPSLRLFWQKDGQMVESIDVRRGEIADLYLEIQNELQAKDYHLKITHLKIDKIINLNNGVHKLFTINAESGLTDYYQEIVALINNAVSSPTLKVYSRHFISANGYLVKVDNNTAMYSTAKFANYRVRTLADSIQPNLINANDELIFIIDSNSSTQRQELIEQNEFQLKFEFRSADGSWSKIGDDVVFKMEKTQIFGKDGFNINDAIRSENVLTRTSYAEHRISDGKIPLKANAVTLIGLYAIKGGVASGNSFAIYVLRDEEVVTPFAYLTVERSIQPAGSESANEPSYVIAVRRRDGGNVSFNNIQWSLSDERQRQGFRLEGIDEGGETVRYAKEKMIFVHNDNIPALRYQAWLDKKQEVERGQASQEELQNLATDRHSHDGVVLDLGISVDVTFGDNKRARLVI